MSVNKESFKKLYDLFDKYSLSKEDRDYLMNIIEPIFIHEEFQRRMTSEFPHHSDITLGEHIIEDTIITYLLLKKDLRKNKCNMDIALKIAMFHDLYSVPWQNNEQADVDKFFNKHGFRHPIEAAINAIAWYPEYFKDEHESKIIIDGIVHHMYPLPVRTFIDNGKNTLELKNYELLNIISKRNKELIKESTDRGKIGNISICPSLFKEGKIMSKADKLVSMKQINNFSSGVALITGHNKSLAVPTTYFDKIYKEEIMKKEQILEEISKIPTTYLVTDIISNIKIALKTSETYQMEMTETSFKINTILNEGKKGSYEEILFNHDNDTNTNSLIIIKKEYTPAYQQRHIMEEIGLNIKTKVTSFVYDSKNRLLHNSNFIDNNNHYGINNMPLDYSKESLLKYFEETNPKYEKGYYKEEPKASFQPYTNIWHRYPNTHVIKEYGKNPIDGEFSKIKITFDDHFLADYELLTENQGSVYKIGHKLKITSEEQVIPEIERIYQSSETEFGFDHNRFDDLFEELMYEKNKTI